MLLIKPDITISTKEAYSGVTPAVPEKSLKELILKPINEWRNTIKNDFEISVFEKYPEIESIKNRLLDMGASYSAMSGSGSAVYGLFEQGVIPERYQDFKDCIIYRGKILDSIEQD